MPFMEMIFCLMKKSGLARLTASRYGFESGKLSAENIVERAFDGEYQMEMIRHQGILIYFQGRMNGRYFPQAVFYDLAEWGCLKIRGSVGAGF